MTDVAQQPYEGVREPESDLKALDALVGKWELSGEAQGTVEYEWMEGGFFLLQHVNMTQDDGTTATGLEVIGHERPFMAEPSKEIKSRYYASNGETLDYVYELEADTLTIWFGEVGSPAYYKGTFSSDGRVLTGAWTFPGGGGYQSTATKVQGGRDRTWTEQGGG